VVREALPRDGILAFDGSPHPQIAQWTAHTGTFLMRTAGHRWHWSSAAIAAKLAY
jgi:hypothetical protein